MYRQNIQYLNVSLRLRLHSNALLLMTTTPVLGFPLSLHFRTMNMISLLPSWLLYTLSYACVFLCSLISFLFSFSVHHLDHVCCIKFFNIFSLKLFQALVSLATILSSFSFPNLRPVCRFLRDDEAHCQFPFQCNNQKHFFLYHLYYPN